MKQEHQALWKKIDGFELDDPAAAFPFSKKLAKENNWPMSFTRLAMVEYKRFLFLCCISPQGASPSQVVDKVWHLHLTYTRSYWDELCSKVLHQQLHHHPSAGGIHEQKKHQAWYKETLELYSEVFGKTPPVAIWPAPVHTELSALACAYKKNIRITPLVWLGVGLIILLFVLITQFKFGVLNPYLLTGPAFLTFMYVLFLHSTGIAILLLLYQRHKLHKLIYKSFPETYMHYGIIDVLYGKTRALQTAIVELVNYQLLIVTPSKKFISNVADDSLLPTGNPLLPALAQEAQNKKLQLVTSPNDELSYEDMKQLYDYHQPDTTASSKIKWLLRQQFSWRWVPYSFVLLLLIIRLIQGLYHHRPVGYLLLGMFLFTIVYALIVFCYSPAVIVKQVLNKKMQEDRLSQPKPVPADHVAADFYFRGTGALAGMENYVLLATIFAMPPNTSKQADAMVSGTGGCGGDGGGGSGGCGGGCGGCGGGCGS